MEGGNPFKHGSERVSIEEYITYDEIALAALVNMAVPTDFINTGGRSNMGKAGVSGTFTESGVVFGAVGARYEMPREMEYKYTFVTQEQNTPKNKYGPGKNTAVMKAWAKFYKMPFKDEEGEAYLPTYDEAKADKSGRYKRMGNGGLLDTIALKIRLRASIEPFVFAAANYVDQAKDLFENKAKKAYLHAVGLGSGVWADSIGSGQVAEELIVDNYLEVLQDYPRLAKKISDIDFSYFRKVSDSFVEARKADFV